MKLQNNKKREDTYFMKNKKRVYKMVALLVASIMTLAACGGNEKKLSSSSEDNIQKTEDHKKEGETNTSAERKEFSYPMDTNETLTWWLQLNPNVSATSASLGDTPFAKELEKQTGVKIEYIHPAQGSENEAFNLLLASGELPDIIEKDWYVSQVDQIRLLKMNILLL